MRTNKVTTGARTIKHTQCDKVVSSRNISTMVKSPMAGDGPSISQWKVKLTSFPTKILEGCCWLTYRWHGIRGGNVKAFAAVACKKTQLIVVLVWCDLGTGTKVGRATMSRNVFHFCLALGKYEANSFHLHAGQCVASDGRAQATNGGVCVPNDIAAHDKY